MDQKRKQQEKGFLAAMPKRKIKPTIDSATTRMPARDGETKSGIHSQSAPPVGRPTVWNAYLMRLLWGLSLLSGIGLTFYIFFTYRVIFHSDAAMKNLLADDMIRTHALFPADWFYVNDIPMLFPHWIVALLALFLPNSFTLHAIACFAFAVLFAFSLNFLYKSSHLEPPDFLLVGSLLFTGVSGWFAENLFGQFAYGGELASTFLVIAFLFQTLAAYESGARRKTLVWSGAFVIFLSVILAGGVRGLIAFVAPMLGALALVALVPSQSTTSFFRPRATLYAGGLVLLATLLGMVGFVTLRLHIHLRNDATAFHYVDYQHIQSNIGLFFQGFLAYSDALPDVNMGPMSLYGVVTAYRLFWFAFVLCLPFVLLLRRYNFLNPHFKFVTIYYVLTFLMTLYIYIFSSLPIGVATFRYFSIPCVVAIVLIGYIATELRLRCGTRAFCWLVAACLPLYTGIFYDLWLPYFHGAGPNHHENVKQPLADYLVTHDLQYGYATYWNAGVLTILSQERTHVNAIQLGGNPPIQPFRWLTSAYAYSPEAFVGPTFLLLTNEEYAGLNTRHLEAYLGTPQSEDSVLGYHIIKYNFNIAARLPGWSGPKDQVEINEPYTSADLRADFVCGVAETIMEQGRPGVVTVGISNRGSKPFLSEGHFPIYFGGHLYSKDLRMRDFNYLLSPLPWPLKAGEHMDIPVPLAALPVGEYILEASMVQGGVAWFGTKKDGEPLLIRVKVA